MAATPQTTVHAEPPPIPVDVRVSGHFRALRHRFDVWTPDPELHAVLDRVLDSFSRTWSLPPPRPGSPPQQPVTYLAGPPDWARAVQRSAHPGPTVTVTAPADRLLSSLLWHVNRRAIVSSPDLCLVHAAVLERDGVAVVLPARMNAGKSTLAARLVTSGYRYLSDEIAVVDPTDARLYPYPKPLSLEPGSWPVCKALDPRRGDGGDRWFVERWQVPVAQVAPGPLTARVVVAPCFEPGATTRLAALSRAEMLMHLAAQTFCLTRWRRRSLATLRRVVETANCWSLTYGDVGRAGEAVDALSGSASAE